jgi:hypothetical protein
MTKAKVIKLQNISNRDEENMQVRTGDLFEGQIKIWPEIGECFYLWDGNQYVLVTTPITELIGDREFKTLNSIYKIVTKEDERDERIKIILQ